MILLTQNSTQTLQFGPFLDEDDGKTVESGLTIAQADVRLSKNGAAFAQKNDASSASYDENGYYRVSFSTTDTNTVGTLLIAIHKSGALPVWREFHVIPNQVYASLVEGSDKLEVDVVQLGGSTQSATDLKDFADEGYDPATNKVQGVVLVDTVTTLSGHTAQTGDNYTRLGAPVGASISADIASVQTDTTAILADIGTPATLGDGATLADMLTAMAGKTASAASYDRTADSLEAIRDRGDTAWTTGGGTGLSSLATGTAQSGAGGYIQLATGEPSTDDYFNGTRVLITGGTGAGQSRVIVDYTGSSRQADVWPNWTTPPDATSTYEVQAAEANLGAIGRDPLNGNNATLRLAKLDIQGSTPIKIVATTGYALDIDSASSVLRMRCTTAGGTVATLIAGSSAGDGIDIQIPNDSGIAIKGQGGVVSGIGAQFTGGSKDFDATIDASDFSGAFPAGVFANHPDVDLNADQSAVTIGTVNTLTGHTAQTGDNYTRLGAPVGASISADIASVQTDTTALLADIGTPVTLGDGATLSDMLTAMAGKTASAASYDRTADSLEAVRDRGDAAWTTGGGGGMAPLHSGAAQGGAAGTITLAAGASAVDDFYNGELVVVTSGTGVGQARIITDYNGTSKVATIAPNWITNPVTADDYEVYPAEANMGAILNDGLDGNKASLRLARLEAVNLTDDAVYFESQATNKAGLHTKGGGGVSLQGAGQYNEGGASSPGVHNQGGSGAVGLRNGSGGGAAGQHNIGEEEGLLNECAGSGGFPGVRNKGGGLGTNAPGVITEAGTTGSGSAAGEQVIGYGVAGHGLELVRGGASGRDLDANEIIDILADTADMQPKLGTPVVDISADIAAIKGDTTEIGVAGAGLTDLGGMSTGMQAEVGTIVDAKLDEVVAEPPPGTPSTTGGIRWMLAWTWMLLRNKGTMDKTTGEKTFHNSAGVPLAKKIVTDDGTTYTENSMVSP